MNIRTLKYSLRRVQPLSAIIQYLKAIDREFEKLGDAVGADEVVVVEREVKPTHTIDDSLVDVIKAMRPDFVSMEPMDTHDRRLFILLFKQQVLAVEWTNLNTGEAVRKILEEVLAV